MSSIIADKTLILASIVGPFFLIYGTSIILYSDKWREAATETCKKHYLMSSVALMQLIIGLILINIYSVWSWNIFAVITLTGWMLFIKGTMHLLLPEELLKTPLFCKCARSDSFFLTTGSFYVVLGVLLTYSAYFGL